MCMAKKIVVLVGIDVFVIPAKALSYRGIAVSGGFRCDDGIPACAGMTREKERCDEKKRRRIFWAIKAGSASANEVQCEPGAGKPVI